MRSFLALVIASAACSSTPTPAPAGPSSTAQSKPTDSNASDDAKPVAKPAPQKDPKAMLAATLARAVEIQKTVADIRELPFQTEVPSSFQSNADFRKFVEDEIKKELPPEKNAQLSKAIHHIGLVKDKLDLAKVFTDAFASQAAAYYDPASKKFYIVTLSTDQSWLDMMASHELTHALQDQHFNLPKYYGEDPDKKKKKKSTTELTEDQLNARRFVVEGEATFIMLVHAARVGQNVNLLQKKTRKALGMQLRMMAGLGWRQLVNMEMARAKTVDDPATKKSIMAMGKIPPYVLVPMLESYTKGALPIYEAYDAGGWNAVADLYKNPPDSTEQVLHPKTKLIGKRDYPVTLSLPKNRILSKPRTTEIHSDVLGELQWRVYFETWEIDGAAEAAAGWDGDRYDVIEVPGGTLIARHVTEWDDDAEAEAFEKAFIASLAKRFPSAKTAVSAGGFNHGRADNTVVRIERVGTRVYIVDGGNESVARALIKDMKRKTRAKKHKNDK